MIENLNKIPEATPEEKEAFWQAIMSAEECDEPIDPEKYVVIDDVDNAIDYLEKVLLYLRSADPFGWKWVVLSLFGALYGCLIAVLKRNDPVAVLRTDGRLLSFPEALKRATREKHMKWLVHSTPLTISVQERRAIDLVHKVFRNSFVHFIPRTWMIELSGVRQLTGCIIDVIDRLVNETGNFPSYKNKAEKVNEIVSHIRNRIRDSS